MIEGALLAAFVNFEYIVVIVAVNAISQHLLMVMSSGVEKVRRLGTPYTSDMVKRPYCANKQLVTNQKRLLLYTHTMIPIYRC